jgi:hypothetical protein
MTPTPHIKSTSGKAMTGSTRRALRNFMVRQLPLRMADSVPCRPFADTALRHTKADQCQGWDLQEGMQCTCVSPVPDSFLQ